MAQPNGTIRSIAYTAVASELSEGVGEQISTLEHRLNALIDEGLPERTPERTELVDALALVHNMGTLLGHTVKGLHRAIRLAEADAVVVAE